MTSQKTLIQAQIALQFHKVVESDKPTKHLTLGFKLNWSFRRYMETIFCTCRAAEGDQKHSEGVDLLDHGVHLWLHREKTLPTLRPSTKHALWSALHLKFFHTIEDCRKKWILLVVSAGRDVLMSEPHRREWTWCGAHFSQGLITSKLCRVI